MSRLCLLIVALIFSVYLLSVSASVSVSVSVGSEHHPHTHNEHHNPEHHHEHEPEHENDLIVANGEFDTATARKPTKKPTPTPAPEGKNCGPYATSPRINLVGNDKKTYVVTPIDKTHLLEPSSYNLAHDQSDNTMLIATACAFNAMYEAAAKDHVSLKIDSAFRTIKRQQYLYNCYIHRSCNGGNLAAYPGTSNHGYGLAVDINQESPGVYSWLKAHADGYSFIRTVESETWHWEHRVGSPRPRWY